MLSGNNANWYWRVQERCLFGDRSTWPTLICGVASAEGWIEDVRGTLHMWTSYCLKTHKLIYVSRWIFLWGAFKTTYSEQPWATSDDGKPLTSYCRRLLTDVLQCAKQTSHIVTIEAEHYERYLQPCFQREHEAKLAILQEHSSYRSFSEQKLNALTAVSQICTFHAGSCCVQLRAVWLVMSSKIW